VGSLNAFGRSSGEKVGTLILQLCPQNVAIERNRLDSRSKSSFTLENVGIDWCFFQTRRQFPGIMMARSYLPSRLLYFTAICSMEMPL
jgi:hypothetical protein